MAHRRDGEPDVGLPRPLILKAAEPDAAVQAGPVGASVLAGFLFLLTALLLPEGAKIWGPLLCLGAIFGCTGALLLLMAPQSYILDPVALRVMTRLRTYRFAVSSFTSARSTSEDAPHTKVRRFWVGVPAGLRIHPSSFAAIGTLSQTDGIVVETAASRVDDAVRIERHGKPDLIISPADPDTLVTALTAMLTKKASRR